MGSQLSGAGWETLLTVFGKAGLCCHQIIVVSGKGGVFVKYREQRLSCGWSRCGPERITAKMMHGYLQKEPMVVLSPTLSARTDLVWDQGLGTLQLDDKHHESR